MNTSSGLESLSTAINRLFPPQLWTLISLLEFAVNKSFKQNPLKAFRFPGSSPSKKLTLIKFNIHKLSLAGWKRDSDNQMFIVTFWGKDVPLKGSVRLPPSLEKA